MLNMYPLPKLPSRSLYHVHGMPKFRVEMNGAEDPRPKKSTVLTILRKREDHMRNPVVRVLLRQGMRARMQGRKSSLARFRPRVPCRPPLQLQAGHIIRSSKIGGQTRNGRFRGFTGGAA